MPTTSSKTQPFETYPGTTQTQHQEFNWKDPQLGAALHTFVQPKPRLDPGWAEPTAPNARLRLTR